MQRVVTFDCMRATKRQLLKFVARWALVARSYINKTSIIMLLFSRTSFIFYKGMNYLNSIWVSKVVEHSFAMGWCQLKVLAVAWNIFLRNSRKCLKYLCESTVFFHSVLFVCVTLGFSLINSELSSESSAFFWYHLRKTKSPET